MISQTSLRALLAFIVSSKCCMVISRLQVSIKEFEEGLTSIKKQKNPKGIICTLADIVNQIILRGINIFVNVHLVIVKLILK